MNKANNARSQQTGKAIRESLLVLLESHPVLELDVSMICQMAEINRSTFYSHYKGIPDVLDDIGSALDRELLTMASDNSNDPVGECFSLLAEQVSSHAAFFNAWLSLPDSAPKFRFLTEKIIEPLINSLPHKNYQTEYYEHGIWAMLQLWLKSGLAESPQEIARIFVAHLPAYNPLLVLTSAIPSNTTTAATHLRSPFFSSSSE